MSILGLKQTNKKLSNGAKDLIKDLLNDLVMNSKI